MSPVAKLASRANHNFPAGTADHDRSAAWLDELPDLLWRYADQGITHDVGQMDLADLQSSGYQPALEPSVKFDGRLRDRYS